MTKDNSGTLLNTTENNLKQKLCQIRLLLISPLNISTYYMSALIDLFPE